MKDQSNTIKADTNWNNSTRKEESKRLEKVISKRREHKRLRQLPRTLKKELLLENHHSQVERVADQTKERDLQSQEEELQVLEKMVVVANQEATRSLAPLALTRLKALDKLNKRNHQSVSLTTRRLTIISPKIREILRESKVHHLTKMATKVATVAKEVDQEIQASQAIKASLVTKESQIEADQVSKVKEMMEKSQLLSNQVVSLEVNLIEESKAKTMVVEEEEAALKPKEEIVLQAGAKAEETTRAETARAPSLRTSERREAITKNDLCIIIILRTKANITLEFVRPFRFID